MALDHGSVFAKIQEHLHSAAPIEDRMAAVISSCERTVPHPDWAVLRALPYDDLAQMREWLRIPFEQEPPEMPLAGLWFGLFHPSDRGGETTTDIRLGGSTRFSDDGERDWAYGLAYRPANQRAFSKILQSIHRIAYGGDRITSVRGEGRLGNTAVWSLCLAYAAFAVQQLLADIEPELILRGGGSVGVAVGFDSGDYLLVGRLTPEGLVRI
jgi:hypothetical protein